MFKNQLRNVFRPKTFPMQIAIQFGAFQRSRVFTIDLDRNTLTFCHLYGKEKVSRTKSRLLYDSSDLPLRDSSYCYLIVCRR